MGDHGFKRTTCACAECVACCKRQPGPLAPGDLEPILKFLAPLVFDYWEQLFWASPGAVLANRSTGRVFRVGTITPQLRDGRCVFLDAYDRCQIHEVAPFGCAYFDPHMTGAEWMRRATWLYRQILDSGSYYGLRRLLPDATSWRPR